MPSDQEPGDRESRRGSVPGGVPMADVTTTRATCPRCAANPSALAGGLCWACFAVKQSEKIDRLIGERLRDEERAIAHRATRPTRRRC